MFSLKKLIKRDGGAVSTAAAALGIAAVIAGVLVLSASALAEPAAEAYIMVGDESITVFTRCDTIDGFIAEQSALLHPFDSITYAGYTDDGKYEIAVERAPVVIISDGGSSRTVRALKGEVVGELLVRERYQLAAADVVCPGVDTLITGNCEVVVTRGFPVSISVDGDVHNVLAAGMTVGQLLAREDIALAPEDELNVPLDSPVREDMSITVSRVEYREREKSTFLPFETVYEDSPLLKIGDTSLKTAGRDGEITITIRDKYVNGVKISSEVVNTCREEPVSEVILRGTAMNTPYSKREGDFTLENGLPTEYAYVLNGKVTAYTAPAGSGTYSGRPLVIGSCGVDPDVIPFGSELYIVSEDGSHVYGYAIASDTGDITDIIADVYMGTTADNYDEALWWSAQFCNVYVLTVGDNSVSWR